MAIGGGKRAAGEYFANSEPESDDFGHLRAASAALCAKRESEENFEIWHLKSYKFTSSEMLPHNTQ